MPAPSRPLGSDTITIRVPTKVVNVRDGSTSYSYANGAVIEDCSFQPYLMTEKFQEEFTLERESSRNFFRLFLPWTDVTEALTSEYRILFEGVEYEIHSEAGKWRDFRGVKNHLAFLVKLRRG